MVHTSDPALLRLPGGELLDVHGVCEVGAAGVGGLAEEHVDPLGGVEGVPEDVVVPVQARPQEGQAGDEAPVPPDPAAPAVHHAEPRRRGLPQHWCQHGHVHASYG